MYFAIVIVLFLVLVIYLLFAPIILCIDTFSNQYYIKLKGFATVSLEQHEKEILRLKFKILFFKFYVYPLKKTGSPKTKTIAKTTKKKRKTRIGFSKGLRLLKTFKIKRLAMDIDTGDYVTNAKLYPLFTFLNYKYGNFTINYEGRTQLVLHMQNRPIDIIKNYYQPLKN